MAPYNSTRLIAASGRCDYKSTKKKVNEQKKFGKCLQKSKIVPIFATSRQMFWLSG